MDILHVFPALFYFCLFVLNQEVPTIWRVT